jgi:HK97 family phage prohead protease
VTSLRAPLLSISEWKASAPQPGAPVPAILRSTDTAGTATVTEGEALSYVMSSERVDRPGDTIRAAGWQLADYRANPVLLFGHDASSPPVGRIRSVNVEGTRLIGRQVEFTPEDVHPFGALIGRMVRGGFLNASSVGFQPLTWAFNEQRGGVDFLEQALLEHSVVPVPANPEALVGAKSMLGSLATYRAWVEKALDGGTSVLVVPRTSLEATRKVLAPVMVQSAGVPAAEKSAEVQPTVEEAPAAPAAEEPAPEVMATPHHAEPAAADPVLEALAAITAEVKAQAAQLRALEARLAAPAPAPAPSKPAPAKAARPVDVDDLQARVVRAVDRHLRAALGRVD